MMCEMKPSQVFAKLLKFDVPLESCLNIVNQFSILDAEAYLEFRLGRVNRALELYEKVESIDQDDGKAIQGRYQKACHL